MDFSAVIVAAGSGTRAGGEPKQWRMLGGRPVARWSAEAMVNGGARQVVVVVRPGDRALAEEALAGLPLVLVEGGAERTHSVRAGLAALDRVEAVLIHDAARPFLGREMIDRLLEALGKADGAAPGLPVADTLRAERDGRTATLPRAGLWRVQTPQAFRWQSIVTAYDALPAEETASDDAAVVEAAGGGVAIVPGDPRLFKLTWPEDFAMAEILARERMETRIGAGFDAHRLGEGDHLWLCGVRIAHERGLVGHSDADVGLHALTDAILGAAGLGDIGEHFPPTDPRWKGAASEIFLRKASDLVRGQGGEIVSVDVTLICERPKVQPHRPAMRQAIGRALGLDISRVSVKATTTEGMGFTGRGEGIAAQATATLRLPALP